MSVLDDNSYWMRPDQRYIACCPDCGRELLKKKAVTILARDPYLNPKTIGHFCPSCFAALCEKYGLAEE